MYLVSLQVLLMHEDELQRMRGSEVVAHEPENQSPTTLDRIMKALIIRSSIVTSLCPSLSPALAIDIPQKGRVLAGTLGKGCSIKYVTSCRSTQVHRNNCSGDTIHPTMPAVAHKSSLIQHTKQLNHKLKEDKRANQQAPKPSPGRRTFQRLHRPRY